MDFILVLHPNGDISINQFSIVRAEDCKCVYHKTYNPEDTIQDNLIQAYKKWEELNNNE